MTAETAAWVPEPSPADFASMGPRSFDRGNNGRAGQHAQRPRGASMGPRSFDRGNEAAGIRPTTGHPASMGPRSFDRGNSAYQNNSPPYTTLQWGRGRLTAETRKPSSSQVVSSAASMGPRSFDRGNVDPHARAVGVCAALQWGRGRLTAETNRFRELPGWHSGFNGAAVV